MTSDRLPALEPERARESMSDWWGGLVAVVALVALAAAGLYATSAKPCRPGEPCDPPTAYALRCDRDGIVTLEPGVQPVGWLLSGSGPRSFCAVVPTRARDPK